MSILTKEYIKFTNYKKLNLDLMYEANSETIKALDYDLEQIVLTESPLTYNTLKERLREIFEVGKISSKALEIILEHLNKFNFYETKNFYDNVLWKDSNYSISYLRIGYERQIYDIPKEEMGLIFNEFKNENLDTIELYHKVLNYLGYSVLTKKAKDYLDFVYEYLK